MAENTGANLVHGLGHAQRHAVTDYKYQPFTLAWFERRQQGGLAPAGQHGVKSSGSQHFDKITTADF
jgi:hypothetical protein